MTKRLLDLLYPKKRRRWVHYLPVLFFVIIITSLMMLLIYENTVIYEHFEIEMKIKVRPDRFVGINTDTDCINFGGVPGGAIGERIINVTNGDEHPHLIRIKAKGYIGEWVTVSDNNFILDPHSVKEVRIKAHVPLKTQTGNYTGILEVVFENIVGY